MDGQLYEQETHAIRQLVQLRNEIEDLRMALEESSVLRSPRMDGMPRGTTSADAMTRSVIRKEGMRRRLDAAEWQLPDARRAAAEACARLPVDMRAFCEIYYIDDLGYELARTFAGVSDKRCSRFMDMIEGE